MSRSLTRGQVTSLRDTFELVGPVTDQAAAAFYERLFALEPELRELFGDDMRRQGRMLMAALGHVVAHADAPERLIDVLVPLGERHAGYGVEARHYALVGAALLGTLEELLGRAFTLPVRRAWADAYALVSDVMIDAARAAQATRSA